jgi:hypothetical protein
VVIRIGSLVLLLVALTLGAPGVGLAQQTFQDVPPSDPFFEFIEQLVSLNVTSGCNVAPPLYCPTNPVTREQMAAFMIKLRNTLMPQVVDAGKPAKFVGRTLEHGPGTATVALEIQGRLFMPIEVDTTGFLNQGSLYFTEPGCQGQAFLNTSPVGGKGFPRKVQFLAVLPPGKTLWIPDPNASPGVDTTVSTRDKSGTCSPFADELTLHRAVSVQDLSGLFQPPFDLL